MHWRHPSLLAAGMLMFAAQGARAQKLQSPAPPLAIVVNVGGTFTWTAKAIEWGSASSDMMVSRLPERRSGSASPRAANEQRWTSVDLLAPASADDASLMQWTHSATPRDVTLTMMSATGTPVAKYLLRNAVPTKVSTAQRTAGTSQIPMTRVTLTAQSVTTLTP